MPPSTAWAPPGCPASVSGVTHVPGLNCYLCVRTVPGLYLLQPVRHGHLPVHRRGGDQVLLDLLALASAPVERAEAVVAMGDERAHAELTGERQRLVKI